MGEKNNLNILGERLREIRIKKKLSQKELAKILNVTPASLSSYETGTKKPSLNVLIDIAKKCNTSLDWLCGLREQENIIDEVKTYSDIIKRILEITANKNLDFRFGDMTISAFIQNSTQLIDISVAGFCFGDDAILSDLLEDLKKMFYLYENKSIDKEVYDLWIEKTLIKFNYPIKAISHKMELNNIDNISNNIDDDLPF